MIPLFRFLCFALFAASFTNELSAADILESRVDEIVRTEMARQKIPGVAVTVLEHGVVRVSRGYGLANVEHEVPVTPDTIFQIGSVGKQFTAVLTMLLVEDGKIALTDSITKYFAEGPASWEPITVRHLLTHTSGIPNYEGAGFDLQRNFTGDELIRYATGLKLQFAPGARWNYSNTGYMLLGFLIQRATGRFYGDLLHDRVFIPTGMQTARVISDADIVPHRAGGYHFVNGELKNQEWVSPILNTTADGCLYLSLRDFVAWDQAWRSQTILKPESWALIRAPVHLNSGRAYPYGFGINLFDQDGQRVERHSGAWQGFKAFRARYVGDDFSILVLANLAEAAPDRIADAVAELLRSKATSEVTPVPQEEPSVTLRLARLLVQARERKLTQQELLYVTPEFFPAGADRLATKLAGGNSVDTSRLTEKFELGDDVIYRYEVTWGGQKLIVRIGITPDDKISMFAVN